MIIPVAEAKRKLLEFARQAGEMSAAEYESIQKTREILSDPEAMASLEKSKEDIQAGRLVSWKDLKGTIINDGTANKV